MKIIKRGVVPKTTKRITCSQCETIFEVDNVEAKYTDQLGVVLDGLSERYVKCPVCGITIYFEFPKK